MPMTWLILMLAAIATFGYQMGRARALKSAGGDRRGLHSLPVYYGANVAMWSIVPAAAVLIVWILAQPFFINAHVLDTMTDTVTSEDSSIGLVMSDVRRVAHGLDTAVEQGAMTRAEAAAMNTQTSDVRARLGEVGVALGSSVSPEVLKGAQLYRTLNAASSMLRTVIV